MSEIPVGTPVEVHFKGTVSSLRRGRGNLVPITREDGTFIQINREYVTVIEPEYAGGGVYVDANGENWLRSIGGNSWYAFGTTRRFEHEYPLRPLRKLDVEATSNQE